MQFKLELDGKDSLHKQTEILLEKCLEEKSTLEQERTELKEKVTEKQKEVEHLKDIIQETQTEVEQIKEELGLKEQMLEKVIIEKDTIEEEALNLKDQVKNISTTWLYFCIYIYIHINISIYIYINIHVCALVGCDTQH